MQYTENLNLTKYEANDPTNWLVNFNNNMDKIDSGVGTVASRLTEIESDVSTAISTANTASATATNALSVANSKTSIDDLVSSASTTYSSNKVNELISGIQPGTEIDDSVTSTTKTWSSSKINTEVSAKASINDTTVSNLTTYSSNKINQLIEDVGGFPDYQNKVEVANTSTLTGDNELSASYTTTEDCYIYGKIQAKPSTNSFISLSIGGGGSFAFLNDASKNLFNQTPLFKVKANTTITCSMTSVASGTVHDLSIYKLGIIN
jgi:hypothetical protein